MITVFVHIKYIEKFAEEIRHINTVDTITSKVSIKPKANHVQVGIDYDEFIQLKDKLNYKL